MTMYSMLYDAIVSSERLECKRELLAVPLRLVAPDLRCARQRRRGSREARVGHFYLGDFDSPGTILPALFWIGVLGRRDEQCAAARPA